MSQKKRILLIEDEEDIAALIKLQAELSGFKLHVEVDGINGYRAIEREKPDLVILDIVLGLELGADDYLTKPFSPKILFSKAKAILRRGKEPEKIAKLIKFNEF